MMKSSKPGRNDPCPCGSGRKYKRCCLSQNEKRSLKDVNPAQLKRDMEGSLKKMAKIAETKDMSVEELNRYFVGRHLDDIDDEYQKITGGDVKVQAENLLNEAMEELTPSADAVKLARQALSLYPNLPDAWILIGEHEASNPQEIIPYLEKAVEAGRQDLGEAFFKENQGHFWGVVETRPFMRAMAFLAQALWDVGREDESIEHYLECIKLNPNDNQGLRYALMGYLMIKDRMAEVDALFKQYKNDCGAMWEFTKALYLFKLHGKDSKKASKQLVAAITSNPHVPKYLMGKKKLPADSPDSYAFGSTEEAIAYAEDGLALWQRTPGALKWLSGFV